MGAMPVSFVVIALLTACTEPRAATPFSLQGEGYRCTLLAKNADSEIFEEAPIELLWHADLRQEEHFDFDDSTKESVELIVDGEVRLFIETDWRGDFVGSHHLFETQDSHYKLTVTDGIHSREEILPTGSYYLEGALRIEGPRGAFVYNVKGVCLS